MLNNIFKLLTGCIFVFVFFVQINIQLSIFIFTKALHFVFSPIIMANNVRKMLHVYNLIFITQGKELDINDV